MIWNNNPDVSDFVNVTEGLGFLSAESATIANVGDTCVIPMKNFNGACFSWSGTFAGLSGVFEVAYNAAAPVFFPTQAVSILGGNPVTSISSNSSNSAYEIYAPGAVAARFRCTAISSGVAAMNANPFVFSADPAPSLSNSPVLAAIASTSNVIIGDVSNSPRATSGGLSSVFRLLSAAATTNPNSVKTSAGRLYKCVGYNNAAALRYLKFYNKASAPTVGTDTPVETIPLKAQDKFDLDFTPIGRYFSTGIALCISTGVADNDTGALTAADIIGLNLWYS